MATFEAQIEGLTSLSIDGSSAPTQTELTQFLTDGAKEIINVLPPNLVDLCSSSQSFTSGTADTLNTGKVLRVFRSDGDIKQPCRKVDAMQKGRFSDSEDMNYATVTDPVYYIENNSLDVLPVGGSATYSEVQYPVVLYGDSAIGGTSLTGVTATDADPTVFTKSSHGLSTGDVVKLSNFNEMTEINGMIGTVTSLNANTFEIDGVSADPAETTGGNVVKLGGFPDEAEYLVPLYAAVKSLQNAMGNKTGDLPTDLSITAVPPDVPSLTTVTFASTDSDLDASAPTFTTAVVAAAGVLGTTSGFNAYHPLSDLGDSDPGVLTISVSAPSVAIISTGVTTTAAADIASNAPAYTPPVITNAADGSFAEETNQDITEMSRAAWASLDYDFDNENIDFLKWFQVAGDFIQNGEDTELAAAQLQKINTYISAYQTAMQNKLNDFNEANAKYQASVQAEMQAQKHLAAENTQEATQTMEALIQDTQLELQKYQAQVNDEVQEYSQKLARYQLELNTTLQAWQKEYDASIQESLQELQVANQVNIASGQAALQVAIDNENRSQQRQLQNGVNDMQAIVANNQDLISKYKSELQQYQAEVNAEVQEFANNIQKHTANYQWLDSQYQKLSVEYHRGVQMLMGGGIAPPRQ